MAKSQKSAIAASKWWGKKLNNGYYPKKILDKFERLLAIRISEKFLNCRFDTQITVKTEEKPDELLSKIAEMLDIDIADFPKNCSTIITQTTVYAEDEENHKCIYASGLAG